MQIVPAIGLPIGLDAEQLLLVVPLVERLALVEPLVALQPDEPGAGELGDRLRELRLASARRPLDQHRLLQAVCEVHDSGDAVVGQVVHVTKALTDLGHGIEPVRHPESVPGRLTAGSITML